MLATDMLAKHHALDLSGKYADSGILISRLNISQHVAIIRPAVKGMQSLHELILSPYFQSFIFGEQTGAGRGGLPKNRLDRIASRTPTLAEQNRIVSKVDSLMSLCRQIETEIRLLCQYRLLEILSTRIFASPRPGVGLCLMKANRQRPPKAPVELTGFAIAEARMP